jgi:putative transposase
MPQPKLSAEQKMALVLQGLKGQTSIAEVCRQHGISQNQYYQWRDQFLEGAKTRLSGNKPVPGSDQAKIRELERIIGRQTITIEVLKKIQDLPET